MFLYGFINYSNLVVYTLPMNSTMKYRKWEAKEPLGAFVLVHGMGAGTERWGSLAEYFKARNISSYAVSLKGFDGTEGEEGYVDSFETYHSDIKELSDMVRREVPSGKIFLLGESMGALIAFDIAARGMDIYDGYILISPAFGSRLKFSPFAYLRIMISMLLFPKQQFRMPFTARMCTSDNAQTEKIEKDPSEHRYATGRLLWEIFKRQVTAGRAARRIISPVLFLLSTNDEIADPEKSVKVFNSIGRKGDTALTAIKKYPGMKHALSVETGREEVFRDIYEWMV